MTMYERIKWLREEQRISQSELARLVGYTSRSSINKVEAGLVDLPQSKIAAFAKALNTTPRYLMGWEEAQPINADTLTDSEMEMITALRSLPADVQDSFHAAIKGIAKSQKP